MSPLEQQFDILKEYFPNARNEKLPDNSLLVTIPDFPLPQGWSKPSATINFIAPLGYPLAKPDCFWADPDLRLQHGTLPQSTNISPIPGTNLTQLWFSWHAGHWVPNRDSLLTYVRVIEARLKQLR